MIPFYMEGIHGSVFSLYRSSSVLLWYDLCTPPCPVFIHIHALTPFLSKSSLRARDKSNSPFIALIMSHDLPQMEQSFYSLCHSPVDTPQSGHYLSLKAVSQMPLKLLEIPWTTDCPLVWLNTLIFIWLAKLFLLCIIFPGKLILDSLITHLSTGLSLSLDQLLSCLRACHIYLW